MANYRLMAVMVTVKLLLVWLSHAAYRTQVCPRGTRGRPMSAQPLRAETRASNTGSAHT